MPHRYVASASLVAVARHSVAELSGANATQTTALVRTPTGSLPATRADDRLALLVNRLPLSRSGMMVWGATLAVLGAVLAAVVPVGFVGAVLFGGMMTFGAGIAFLGARKRTLAADAPRAAIDPHVTAERTRRVHAVLSRTGASTFERLLGQLRWTERALVETLLSMKDAGSVIEDLDLDTGEWIYRLQYTDAIGSAGPMTLADRQQHSEHA